MSVTVPEAHWRHVPVRLDVERWATRRTRKRVLVVVHTVIAGQRLLDATRLLEGDTRVQMIFTQAPDVFGNGVNEFLERLGALVLPWNQAVQTHFDLALAAGHGSLHDLQAPVVVLPHGAGHNKLTPVARHGGTAVPSGVYGLSRQRLVRDGTVVPEAIVLAHQEELTRLGRECPEALPVAEVVGDPCFDRIMASLPSRALYRESLAVGPRQRLVLVCSTWGPDSLAGQGWDALERLVAELPRDDYRVAALLHPHVWNAHGEWQVRGWLSGLARSGLVVISQHGDWEGAIVAADRIVGDHGSVSLYGSMTGAPMLMAGRADPCVDPSSPMAELMSFAPRLRPERAVCAQISRGPTSRHAGRYERVAARITSEPGRFARRMRALLYRKLRLRAPAFRAVREPARLPLTVRFDRPESGISR
ncbi:MULTISPECIES: hypothetical protein [Streptomyces]|uniref:Uncharacterized protein n=1 Tax=Streptomyces doudnae TaxID=3075536 RepID=A0ABD5EWF3_9ACTN|nr:MULTISPECIES: hypothetical protein [unclassified Streptomyces]MDT0438344.1 hypothetical protein [Streptomyces sp. DSM 41981]MYQ65536.1 hypothetical protein [Streptomyces sp. SID4950]SCE01902.1 hypothetical protein GA0115242_119645 [Streptomyces sp. SolWspMP-5a-2]